LNNISVVKIYLKILFGFINFILRYIKVNISSGAKKKFVKTSEISLVIDGNKSIEGPYNNDP
jgi:hypothetical protein